MKVNEKGSEGGSRAARVGHRRLPDDALRGFLLIAVIAGLGFGLSACVDSPTSPGVATAGPSSTTTSTSIASAGTPGLEFAECMRAHGVPNWPNPESSNGSTRFFPAPSSGIDIRSAAVSAALETCQKYLPGGGPNAGPPPTAKALAQMLNVARCMRSHGISDFPDPRTSAPSNPAGISEISNRDGVILVFPAGFDQSSPQFIRAAAACGFQVTNH
jgi:hypothetical protein